MNILYRKLFKLTSWNVAAAGINFLTNILIVRIFGLDLFGELAVIMSLCSMLGLSYLLLPSNYSLFKLQDDNTYAPILASFFLMATGVVFVLSYFINSFSVIPFWLLFVLSFSISFRSYFDIVFQVENRLKEYFFFLFVLSITKTIAVVILILSPLEKSIYNLVLFIAVTQAITILIYGIPYYRVFFKGLYKTKEVLKLIWTKKSLFTQYYLSDGLKRVNSNILILLFEPIVSSEVIGVYSLLLKVNSFIMGLARTVEPLLLNRISASQFRENLQKNYYYLGLMTQILYLVVGSMYMLATTSHFYFLYILGLSFLVYPYFYFIDTRAELLSNYKLKPINKSTLIFLAIVLLMGGLIYMDFLVPSLFLLVLTFFSAVLLQKLYLIWYRHNRYNRGNTIT